jgi:hypothetical protein
VTAAPVVDDQTDDAGRRLGLARGRHHHRWLATLDEMRRQGQDAEGLALLLECIEAAEQEARAWSVPPSPTYTRRAAVILRRRRDLEAEVRLLERWVAAFPAEAGHPRVLDVRLARARRLRDARSRSRPRSASSA